MFFQIWFLILFGIFESYAYGSHSSISSDSSKYLTVNFDNPDITSKCAEGDYPICGWNEKGYRRFSSPCQLGSENIKQLLQGSEGK